MIVQAQVTINATRAAVWNAIADIEHAASIVRGIERIEMLHKPAHGLIGLKWRETRILFGDPASVDKWITEAAEPEFYRTRAEDHGFVFLTTKRLTGSDGAITLSEAHESQPQGFAASLKLLPMRLLFKGAIRKALAQDLQDIKAAAEAAG